MQIKLTFFIALYAAFTQASVPIAIQSLKTQGAHDWETNNLEKILQRALENRSLEDSAQVFRGTKVSSEEFSIYKTTLEYKRLISSLSEKVKKGEITKAEIPRTLEEVLSWQGKQDWRFLGATQQKVYLVLAELFLANQELEKAAFYFKIALLIHPKRKIEDASWVKSAYVQMPEQKDPGINPVGNCSLRLESSKSFSKVYFNGFKLEGLVSTVQVPARTSTLIQVIYSDATVAAKEILCESGQFLNWSIPEKKQPVSLVSGLYQEVYQKVLLLEKQETQWLIHILKPQEQMETIPLDFSASEIEEKPEKIQKYLNKISFSKKVAYLEEPPNILPLVGDASSSELTVRQNWYENKTLWMVVGGLAIGTTLFLLNSKDASVTNPRVQGIRIQLE